MKITVWIRPGEARRDLPDWMQHRLAHIRAEAQSLAEMLEESPT